MSKTFVILITFLFGFSSVQSFSIQSRASGVDDEVYSKYICNGKQNGVRILVPGTCTQYFECQSGQSVVKTCVSPNKFFDSSSKMCVATSSCIEPKGDCSTAKPKPKPPCNNKTTTPTSTTPTSTPTTPTTTTRTTPSTIKPSTPHQTPCEIKKQQELQKVKEQLEKQYEEFFASPGQRCESPGGSCRAVSNGSTIPYKNNCSKYIACFNGCGAEILCPEFLHFNQKTGLCDKPQNAGCSS